jgi:hypothetical protein
MADQWVYASGEAYEGPTPPASPTPEPPPNNHANNNDANNNNQPSPHEAVKEGSIRPLSAFTNQLHILDAFLEYTNFYQGHDSQWHFTEYELTAAETRYAFNRNAARGGELELRADFVNCLQGKNIREIDEPSFNENNYNQTYDAEHVDENLYFYLPDPIPFLWLQRLIAGGGGLKMHLFLYDFDNTPSGYNADQDTDWFGDDEHWHFYIMFVQDSATTAKMYIAWQEVGEFSFPDEVIEEFYHDLFRDLKYCLRLERSVKDIEHNRLSPCLVVERQMGNNFLVLLLARL